MKISWEDMRKKYHWKISRKHYREYRRKQYLKNRKKILAYMHKRFLKNRDSLLLKTRIYLRNRRLDPIYRKKCNAASRRYYRLHKKQYRLRSLRISRTQKHHARMMVYHAVKAGFVKKPELCDSCKTRTQLQGHHFDGYKNPLKVSWLCRPCHGIAHRI